MCCVAYRNVKNSFSAFVDFFSSKEANNNWALPTLRVLSEDLKNTAVMVSNTQHRRRTVV